VARRADVERLGALSRLSKTLGDRWPRRGSARTSGSGPVGAVIGRSVGANGSRVSVAKPSVDWARARLGQSRRLQDPPRSVSPDRSHVNATSGDAKVVIDAPCLARTLEPRPGLVPPRRVASQARRRERVAPTGVSGGPRSVRAPTTCPTAGRADGDRGVPRRDAVSGPWPPLLPRPRSRTSTALPYLLSAAESLQVGGNVYYHVEPRAGTELGGALCDRPCDLFAPRLQPSRPALR
jgi:hypothetical protein